MRDEESQRKRERETEGQRAREPESQRARELERELESEGGNKERESLGDSARLRERVLV